MMKKPPRKKLIGCGGCLAAAVLLLLVPPFSFFTLGMYHGLTQRHRLDRAIENDLPEIAAACLTLTQFLSEDEGFTYIDREDPRMPEVIKRTKCRNVGIQQARIEIEMHGGFDHFGILLRQGEADTNVWKVLRYWETGDELLMTITNEQGASNPLLHRTQ